MPTYDYACTECEHRFENFQPITSDPLTECPECKGKVRRLIGRGGALIFKGSGFYETDYKRNGGKKDEAKKGGDASPTESKPAAKAESKDSGTSSAPTSAAS